MTDRRFLFVVSSTREGGNSEGLARAAAASLPEGSETRWLRLDAHPLPPFVDTRHSTGYGEPVGEAGLLADATLWATDLVFVLPVYWYSLPAPLKLYLDHWSAWMRAPALKFMDTMKGRSLWAVIVDSDTADEGSSLPVLDSLRRTAEYMGMQWHGGLVGHGNRPGEVAADAKAQAAARTYFC